LKSVINLSLISSCRGFDGRLNSRIGDDGGSEEFLEFLIFLESEIDESWYDSRFLLLSADHDRDLKDLSNEVLKDGSKINWSSDSNSIRISSLFEESGNSSDWESESSLGRSGALS
jgi:hypothetical protein